MKPRVTVQALLLLAWLCLAPGNTHAAASHELFRDRIEPLLKEHCLECHGSTAKKLKGELRLDSKAGWQRGGESGEPALRPGQPDASLLIKAVRHEGDLAMPPRKKLSDAQIADLVEWVKLGAPDPREDAPAQTSGVWWSLRPLMRPAIPETPDTPAHWARHPIDRFLYAKLAEKKLSPSPPADARTLVRRLHFDLHGLPPTPEQIETFLHSTFDIRHSTFAPLLSSPRFGERWARHWLDVVRFAESDGFETNQPRPNAWPYRDWVIAAFNSDKPFDQFIREQLAGDQFGADAATGFIVGGPWDRVKSPDPVLTAQQRADELHDMVSTTGSSFLGLTVGCARCHNHKFDPIPQREYYALKAVFAGVQHGERDVRPADPARREARTKTLRAELDLVAASLRALEPLARATNTPAASGEASPLRAPVNRGGNVERFDPVEAKFIRFTITATTQLEPCIDELEVFTAGAAPRNVALATNGGKASASSTLPGYAIHKLENINDGRYGNDWSWISNERGRGWVRIEFAKTERIDRVLWSRDRDKVPRYEDRTATGYEVAVSLDGERWSTVASSADRLPFKAPRQPGGITLATGLSSNEVARANRLIAERSRLERELQKLDARDKVYAGKLTAPEETRRLHRGDAMQPRELVAAGGIGAAGGAWSSATNAPESARRLALADWIASPTNPLTARVIVNRLWHYHFGIGLVDTPSDLGANGGRPSHPELLDWLAAELVKPEWNAECRMPNAEWTNPQATNLHSSSVIRHCPPWSLKHLHRLILSSAAYQQSSGPNDAALRVDAGNRLLWRFPPRRIEAEALRDAMLTVSGRLDLRMGGPGFDLFEPNSNYVKVYNTKTRFGTNDFRRMVYQAKPRVELDSLFGAFDCPDAGQIAPRRNVSTTPLQALNLLNSGFALEQSRFFAERLEREAGADRVARVRLGFVLAFGREPAAREREAATKLIEAHGLPAFCRALYNANEFITVF